MPWRLPGDDTPPIITAEGHVHSAHVRESTVTLPPTCVIFEMGAALRTLEARFETVTLLEKLPCFLESPPCIAVRGHEDVCFTRGGFGAPAAVDTLETLRVLGVRQVLVAGMCGGFGADTRVGDVVVPSKILCEEGTSQHYYESIDFALPDKTLFQKAAAHFAADFAVTTAPTVTSDAVYRQTFAKEAAWRDLGCVGVDMEACALLSVSRYYGLPAAAALLCSDKHPLTPGEPAWGWGEEDFRSRRERFILAAAQWAFSLCETGCK